jgi:hypothetical protein
MRSEHDSRKLQKPAMCHKREAVPAADWEEHRSRVAQELRFLAILTTADLLSQIV